MADRTYQVLDVGQCDFDHGNISRLVESAVHARVHRAHTIDEAVTLVGRQTFDLVLVNRVFDRGGEQGLDLIRRLGASNKANGTRLMLVSNFAEAQNQAIALGAVPGFGKSSLDDPATVHRLRLVMEGHGPSVGESGASAGSPGPLTQERA